MWRLFYLALHTDGCPLLISLHLYVSIPSIHPSFHYFSLWQDTSLSVCLSNCISLWPLSPSAWAYLCFFLCFSPCLWLCSCLCLFFEVFLPLSPAHLCQGLWLCLFRESPPLTVPLWLALSVSFGVQVSLCLDVSAFLGMGVSSPQCLSVSAVCASSPSFTLGLTSVSFWEWLRAHSAPLSGCLFPVPPAPLSRQYVCLLTVFLLLCYFSPVSLGMWVFSCVSTPAALSVHLCTCICVFFTEFTTSFLCLSPFSVRVSFSALTSLCALLPVSSTTLWGCVCFPFSPSVSLCPFLFLLVSLLQNVGIFAYTSCLAYVCACMYTCASLLLSNTLVRINTLHSVPWSSTSPGVWY